MKKPEIAKKLARQAGVTEGEAADRLDGVVRHILAELRSGRAANLPGVGRLRAGPTGKPLFEPAPGKKES
jgi:nucleoid DNA-binding protein